MKLNHPSPRNLKYSLSYPSGQRGSPTTVLPMVHQGVPMAPFMFPPQVPASQRPMLSRTSSMNSIGSHAHAHQGGKGRISIAGILTFTIMGLFAIAGWQYVDRKNLMMESLEDDLRDANRDWEEKVDNLIRENRNVAQAKRRANVEIKESEKHVNSLIKSEMQLQSAIQEMSLQALIEQFGHGPHRVEVELAFDPKDDAYEGSAVVTEKVVFEMAPTDTMPHSVYTFLRQVDAGAWNGCSFFYSGHVIQAGLNRNFMTPVGTNLFAPFAQAGFPHVKYQEYATAYQHEAMTVGFAGRPGGPEFYINLQDNSKIHGPGGQGSDTPGADPCFGKVVEGQEVVKHISTLKTNSDGTLRHNVAIKSMNIVKKGRSASPKIRIPAMGGAVQ